MDYLNSQIKKCIENLFVDYPADEKHSKRYDIFMQFREGEFPDLEKYSLVKAGIVIGEIEFIEFLKSERYALLKEITKTTVKVPVEPITPENNQLHELIVQIPPQFFDSLAQNQQPEESDTKRTSGSKQFPKPKLYTHEQTSELMNVSISTVDNLTKDGTLKCHRIGNTSMKRYKWEDIDDALEVMEMRLNWRFGN